MLFAMKKPVDPDPRIGEGGHGRDPCAGSCTARDLREGALAISARENWSRITGHVVSYRGEAKTIDKERVLHEVEAIRRRVLA